MSPPLPVKVGILIMIQNHRHQYVWQWLLIRLDIDALLNTNLLVMIGFGTGPGLFLGGITGIIFSLGRKKKAKSNLGWIKLHWSPFCALNLKHNLMQLKVRGLLNKQKIKEQYNNCVFIKHCRRIRWHV